MEAESKTWWNETKQDPAALVHWLRRQFVGETTAADRILAVRDRFTAAGSHAWRVLSRIAGEERKHASWVGELLDARGIARPEVTDAEARYWVEPMQAFDSIETACAVGAHAEAMRLARINAIVLDTDAPRDIHETFARILGDELGHEQMFRELAGAQAMEATRDAHESGARALGLVA